MGDAGAGASHMLGSTGRHAAPRRGSGQFPRAAPGLARGPPGGRASPPPGQGPPLRDLLEEAAASDGASQRAASADLEPRMSPAPSDPDAARNQRWLLSGSIASSEQGSPMPRRPPHRVRVMIRVRPMEDTDAESGTLELVDGRTLRFACPPLAPEESPGPSPARSRRGSVSAGTPTLTPSRDHLSPTPALPRKASAASLSPPLNHSGSFAGTDSFRRSAQSAAAPREYQVDHVFWGLGPEPVGNDVVYELVGAPVLASALDGFNTCIFAYGQTGSGKTHTVLGDRNDDGIAVRIVNSLFDSDLVQRDAEQGVMRKVTVSFMEIYNERVRDLLDQRSQSRECRVREHPVHGVFVDGLKQVPVANSTEALRAVQRGIRDRATAETMMNADSSRSHAVFQLRIDTTDARRRSWRTACLSLVDLAGSEALRRTGATGQTKDEGININLSLSKLRLVFDRLLERQQSRSQAVHIPYRESLLTRVLQDSLGGNSYTTMIACVSADDRDADATRSTLHYAVRASAIVCKAKKNETDKRDLAALRSEVETLKQELQRAHQLGADDSELDAALRLREESLREAEARYQELQRCAGLLREQAASGAEAQKEVQRLRGRVSELEGQVARLQGAGDASSPATTQPSPACSPAGSPTSLQRHTTQPQSAAAPPAQPSAAGSGPGGLRAAAGSPPAPAPHPQQQGAAPIPPAELAGEWERDGGKRHTVAGGSVHWASGGITPLEVREGGAVVLNGFSLVGADLGGTRLRWRNKLGAERTWVRVGPQPSAAPPSKAPSEEHADPAGSRRRGGTGRRARAARIARLESCAERLEQQLGLLEAVVAELPASAAAAREQAG
eukprot:TRINITY_DN5400_c0_g3_i1.p1 TRINITY_DN5400_c0_g3~~TRINITY_DN5400_c0_g3_i1.p1  ORF type:complete len:867 (+),score=225.14 TRINITY_DN5400_c0_g3_i1:70-2601(+)